MGPLYDPAVVPTFNGSVHFKSTMRFCRSSRGVVNPKSLIIDGTDDVFTVMVAGTLDNPRTLPEKTDI